MCNGTTAILMPEPPAYWKKQAKYNDKLQMHSENIYITI